MHHQETSTTKPPPVLTAILGLTALTVFAAGENLQRRLQYDTTAIQAGQWWRLLTQHLTHWDLSHFAWDMLVFLILGIICELRNRRQFIACLVLAAPAISLAVAWRMPGITLCRGLSGLASALFALLLCHFAMPEDTGRAVTTAAKRQGQRQDLMLRRSLVFAAACLFLSKCVWEHRSGTTLFVTTAANGPAPLPLAHMIGFACGLIPLFFRQEWRSPQVRFEES